MKKVKLFIDGKEIIAPEGEKILWAALDNGIYIPHLCAVRKRELPFGACRLCLVEVEGRSQPVAACVEPVAEGMRVYTDTPRLRELRAIAFELILSHHLLDCRNCPKSGECALQEIARKLGFKLKLSFLPSIPRELEPDESHPLIGHDPRRCVLCGRCVWACENFGAGVLEFAFRGIEMRVSTFFNTPLGQSECNSCLYCVAACPVGGFYLKRDAPPEAREKVKKIKEELFEG